MKVQDMKIDKKLIDLMLTVTIADIKPIIILSLRAGGYTYREIAEALDISHTAVMNVINKWDLATSE